MMPKHEKPFHLDMGFDEALRRFMQTNPQELDEPGKIKKAERGKRAAKPKPHGSAANETKQPR